MTFMSKITWTKEAGNVYSCEIGEFSLEVWPISECVVCVSDDFDGKDRHGTPSKMQSWKEERWAVSVFKGDVVIYEGHDARSVLASTLNQAQHLAVSIAGVVQS